MQTFIDIRVFGGEEELKSIVGLFALMRYAGQQGTCQTFSVIVDGDGSGKITAQLLNGHEEIALDEQSKSLAIQLMQREEPIKVWIGE